MAITVFGSRVVAKDVLLREVSGNLIEGDIKFRDALRKINRTSCLFRQLFHPSFGSEGPQVCTLVESSLNNIDLAVVSEDVLHHRVELTVMTGRFDSIRHDDNDTTAGVWPEIRCCIEDRIKQRRSAFGFPNGDSLLKSSNVIGECCAR